MKQNSIDQLVENLSDQFSKIKNFNLMLDDPMGQKFFTFIVQVTSELTAFKNLFIQYYLPASLKSSQDFTRELKFSKYKNFININYDELKENYYETIRLGYVGAFHKYESYINNLPVIMDDFFREMFAEFNYIPTEKYLKIVFDIELKKTINVFYPSQRINWISNCVKHYDGYPLKEPINSGFISADKSKRLQFDSKEFKADMDNLIKQNQLILNTLFIVGFHQYLGLDYGLIESEIVIKNKIEVEEVQMKLGLVINKIFEKNIA